MLNRNEAANFCALPRESREQVFGRAVAVEQHIIAAVVAAERKDRGQFFGEAALRFGRRRHRMKEPAILRRRHWQRLLVWRIIRPGGEYLRSGGRRVGEEGVSTCRSRLSPDP